MAALPASTTQPPQRITDEDADWRHLHATTVRALDASLRRYVRDLRRASQPDLVVSGFIARHTEALRHAYAAGHAHGVRDYYETVSREKAPHVAPDQDRMARRLTFYAPSVAKMAREGLAAERARRHGATATLAETVALADDPTAQWYRSLSVRVDLQADLGWAGLQDGYADGGAVDPARPFEHLWWLLGPVKESHCGDCIQMALDSPYDPPGTGYKELMITPGDGHTQCGAGCRCTLEYGAGDLPNALAWVTKLPASMKAQWPAGSEPGLLLPARSSDLSLEQEHALDQFRRSSEAWDAVRGALPPLPDMFGWNTYGEGRSLQDVYFDGLSQEQQDALALAWQAMVAWQEATAAEEGKSFAEDDDSIKLINYHHDRYGRFAPGDGIHGESQHEHEAGSAHGGGVAKHLTAGHHSGGGGGGGGSGESGGAGHERGHDLYPGRGEVVLQPRHGGVGIIVRAHLDGQYSVEGEHGGRGHLDAHQMRQVLEHDYGVARGTPLEFGSFHVRDMQEPAPGQLRMKTQGHIVDIRADAGGHFEVHIEPNTRDTISHLNPVYLHQQRMSAEELHTWLGEHRLAHVQPFVELAREDAARYARPDAQMRQRIAETNARRAELDAKYGPYSEAALQRHTQDVMARFPPLASVLNAHLAGAAYANEDTLMRAYTLSRAPDEAVRAAHEGIAALHEVAEWSLLHAPQTAPDGTIRLFHGVGTTTYPAELTEWLGSGEHRAGMSWSTDFGTSRTFAEPTYPYGRAHAVLAARVPASHVTFWHEMLPPGHVYKGEHEYIVGAPALAGVSIIDVGAYSINQALSEQRGD